MKPLVNNTFVMHIFTLQVNSEFCNLEFEFSISGFSMLRGNYNVDVKI